MANTSPCRPLDPITVAHIAEGLDDLASAAMEGLSGGSYGVVIVNTVQRAQDGLGHGKAMGLGLLSLARLAG
jgi:hypothetical protein